MNANIGINVSKKKNIIKKTPESLLDQGNKSLESNKIDEAIETYKKLLLIDRNHIQSLSNIAYCYMLKEDYKNSKNYIFRAIKIKPDNEFLQFNLGNLYKKFGKLNLALRSYNNAIKINSNIPNFKFNKSYILLKKKLYKDGWALYDNRILAEYTNTDIYKIIKNNIYNKKLVPQNLKIIIVPEQGIGDQILFSSMYKEFIKLNPECKIVVDDRLLKIFKRSFKFKDFILESNLNKIFYYVKKKYLFIYAGSLGKFFRNNIIDFKNKPYLTDDKKISKKYQDILLKYNKKKYIGISWKSGSKSFLKKSFRLEDFSKLINNRDNRDIGFVNLQYGKVKQEINNFNSKNKNKIIDIQELDKFNNLDDLASLISNLDLVITVANINSNFASSLGTETWEIIHDDNEHFLYSKKQNRNCEWYDKLKIFYIKKNLNNTLSEIIKRLRNKF
ncbi:MAG: hypothetical protein CFH22_01301 [Alphaproteobacteria bacterium MarineAlpha5_Bin12]|nr:hypothetical protein [Pelagibacteraceae bacterium]PPR40804.1 MAG: hypothetical protein CFH22_01301 [Alphaproteobacteria bacterium MarineAlpha5_Bin12]|tara:strand:- start:24645 stop:25979 length:1335 start_codon:yes stop_codon:yes gene_type:complete